MNKAIYAPPQLVTLDAARLRSETITFEDVRRMAHQALDNLLNGDWRGTRDVLERLIVLIESA